MCQDSGVWPLPHPQSFNPDPPGGTPHHLLSKPPGKLSLRAKGQVILKCPFGVFKSPKKPSNFFPGFLP